MVSISVSMRANLILFSKPWYSKSIFLDIGECFPVAFIKEACIL